MQIFQWISVGAFFQQLEFYIMRLKINQLFHNTNHRNRPAVSIMAPKITVVLAVYIVIKRVNNIGEINLKFDKLTQDK